LSVLCSIELTSYFKIIYYLYLWNKITTCWVRSRARTGQFRVLLTRPIVVSGNSSLSIMCCHFLKKYLCRSAFEGCAEYFARCYEVTILSYEENDVEKKLITTRTHVRCSKISTIPEVVSCRRPSFFLAIFSAVPLWEKQDRTDRWTGGRTAVCYVCRYSVILRSFQ
jgi:hypothetical protein